MAVFGPAFLVGCLVAAIGATFPFGAFELGIVISVFYAGGAIAALFAAVWVDRVGARAVLVIATLVTAASTAASAFAPNWQMMALAFAVGGWAAGVAGPAAMRLLMSAVAPRRRAMAIAMRQSAAPLAAILIGVFAALAQGSIGWRATFIGYAGLAALVALITFVVGHEGTVIKRLQDTGNLHSRTAALLIVASTLMGAAISSFSGFVVASGIAIGISPEAAALLLAVSSVAAIVARLIGGWAADRRKGGHLLRVAVLLALGAASSVAVAFAPGAALFVPAVIAVSMTAWSSNALYTYAVVNRQAHAPARATGIVQLGAFAGSAVGPFLFGFAADHGGQTVAWLFLAAWLLLAAGVVWQARRDWMLRIVTPGN
jgi:predicted MFS family arabinose efflux permease